MPMSAYYIQSCVTAVKPGMGAFTVITTLFLGSVSLAGSLVSDLDA